MRNNTLYQKNGGLKLIFIQLLAFPYNFKQVGTILLIFIEAFGFGTFSIKIKIAVFASFRNSLGTSKYSVHSIFKQRVAGTIVITTDFSELVNTKSLCQFRLYTFLYSEVEMISVIYKLINWEIFFPKK